MERGVRYELLTDEEECPPEEPCVTVREEEDPVTAIVEMIPSEEMTAGTSDGMIKIPEPPSYNIATSLPSYEEAEEMKQTEEELRREQELQEPEPDQSPLNAVQKVGDLYLGTDGIFICSFLLAFLFNCLGLFAILCVSQTIAARFGAVSGFGLSIVKYVALMKYQNWVSSWNDGYSWLWWFMLFLGLLMFFRGSMQYIRIKHQWAKLSQQARGRIYLYF